MSNIHTKNESQIIHRDLKVVWHPCTQMKDHEKIPMIPIKKGKGVWLTDYKNNKYIDAISSWWVNLFGHSNTYINNKITKQLKNLEHVLLAGFTHMPAIQLAERLINISPNKKTHLKNKSPEANFAPIFFFVRCYLFCPPRGA